MLEVGAEQLSRATELLSESCFMLDLLPRAMSVLEQYPFGWFSDECCDLAQLSS